MFHGSIFPYLIFVLESQNKAWANVCVRSLSVFMVNIILIECSLVRETTFVREGTSVIRILHKWFSG